MSHANIISDIIGVEPSYIPSSPRGWERSRQGQGPRPESLIKSKDQPSLDRAETNITMDLQEEDGPEPFRMQTNSAKVMQVTIRSLISPLQVSLLNYGYLVFRV